jgi:Protein of unknown function (DUF2971)
MELSVDRFLSIFQPAHAKRLLQLGNKRRDLVHYTSASNAMRILRNARVTLRNASLMNDFSEIDHGEKCVLQAWHSDLGRGKSTPYSGKLAKILNSISPTILPAIEHEYDRNLAARKSDTFILSLAEHDDKREGRLGRLSMWRAYGGRTNVAIVVDPTYLYGEAAGGAYSAPVIYSAVDSFTAQFFKPLVESIEENYAEISKLDRDYIVECLAFTLSSMSMTTKHPGFSEEQEWRIIYAPWQNSDAKVASEILDIAGIPQKVQYVKLDGSADLSGKLTVSEILKKIIIGPTENPWILYEAFVNELQKSGVKNPDSKVIVSDIPIRR